MPTYALLKQPIIRHHSFNRKSKCRCGENLPKSLPTWCIFQYGQALCLTCAAAAETELFDILKRIPDAELGVDEMYFHVAPRQEGIAQNTLCPMDGAALEITPWMIWHGDRAICESAAARLAPNLFSAVYGKPAVKNGERAVTLLERHQLAAKAELGRTKPTLAAVARDYKRVAREAEAR